MLASCPFRVATGCQKVSAPDTTQDELAMDLVATSMLAQNVARPIRPTDAKLRQGGVNRPAAAGVILGPPWALSQPRPLPTQSPLPTPVQPKQLAVLLRGYNRQIIDYLYDGFTYGFEVGFEGPSPSQSS